MIKRVVLFSLLLLVGCGGGNKVKKSKNPLRDTATLLSLSLRSADARCGGLCDVTEETSVAMRIKELSPDMVLLQSVQSQVRCDDPGDRTADTVCQQSGQQVERLLPAGYAIRCNERGSLCFGVRRSTGAEIPGCPNGLCTGSLPALEGAATKCTDYPPSATNFAEAAVLPISWWNGAQFRAINVDWTTKISQGFCRELAITALFAGMGGKPALSLLTMPDLAAGTFGFDPYATGRYRDAFTETVVWQTYVGNTTATTWSYLSGAKVTDVSKPPATDRLLGTPVARVDHVIGNRLEGRCEVLDGSTPTLWSTPGNSTVVASGLRHYGLFCQLDLSALAIK